MNGPVPIALLACSVLEKEIALHSRDTSHIRETRFVEMGMHDHPGRMRAVLQSHIDELDRRADIGAIVLVYGLCGLGTAGLYARRYPLVIPRAHDCITLFMGGGERYAAHRRACSSCYYYSPGWNRKRRVPGPERLDALRADYAAKYDPETVEDLIDAERGQWAGCDSALFLDLGTDDADSECAYAQKCAQWLGWRFERMRGDPALLRDLIGCAWDEERFQIVPPGMRLGHAPNESIMCAEPVEVQP